MRRTLADAEEPTCRICRDSETSADDPLISPCLCSGSTRYVHRKCLLAWRSRNAGLQAYYRCEICHFRYQYRRVWWAALFSHGATITLMFAVLLVGTTWLLGYAPVIELALRWAGLGLPYDTAGGSGGAGGQPWWLHVLDGLVVVDVLGLLGLSVAACLMGACEDTCCESCCEPVCEPACEEEDCPCADCERCDCATDAGGRCAAVLACSVVTVATGGLAYVLPVMFCGTHACVKSGLKNTSRFVENVGPTGSCARWWRGSGGRSRRPRGGGVGRGDSRGSGGGGGAGPSRQAATQAPRQELMV